MYLKVKYPQCFEYSINDIRRRGKGTCSFGISIADLENVFAKAKEAGIPICIDTKKLYFNCDKNYNPTTNVAGYTVTISKDDVMKMDTILTNEAVRAKRKHILSLEDIQEYSYNRNDTTSPSNNTPSHNSFDER